MYGSLLITCACDNAECPHVDLRPPPGYIEDPYARAKALLMEFYARNGLPVPPRYTLHRETVNTMCDPVKIQALRVDSGASRSSTRGREAQRKDANAAALRQMAVGDKDRATAVHGGTRDDTQGVPLSSSPADGSRLLDALALAACHEDAPTAAAAAVAVVGPRRRGRPPKSAVPVQRAAPKAALNQDEKAALKQLVERMQALLNAAALVLENL